MAAHRSPSEVPEPGHTPPPPAAFEARMLALARSFPARWPDLHESPGVPPGLWDALRDHGLLGAGIPRAWGGLGGDGRLVAAGARGLAAGSGSAGLTLTWLGQHTIAHFLIARLGNASQKADLLPRMAAGTLRVAIAISEPGAGAHPKHLSTRLVRTPGGACLEGEKAWVTSGPVAELFIVLAIDGEAGGRKRFSAWLVPADRPGLERTPGVPVPFLKPAQHCGLALRGVPVAPGDRLGPQGEAFTRIALPLRRIEDALGLSARAGLVEHAVGLLPPGGLPEATLAEERGTLAAWLALLGAAAGEAARLVGPEPAPALDALVEGGRIAADSALASLRRLAGEDPGASAARGLHPRLQGLIRDLEGLGTIAARARAARRARLGHGLRTSLERGARAGEERHARK